MRALARSAAALLAIAACGPNPFFKLADESNDRGASSTGASTDDEATSADVSTSVGSGGSGSTAGGPDLPSCEPAPVEPDKYVESDCAASQFRLPLPNMITEPMFDGVMCGTTSTLYIKRTANSEFLACPDHCVGDCYDSQKISIAGVEGLAAFDLLLPQVDQCARLVHISRPDKNDVCRSVAYAFWDDEGSRQLRLAASAELNPFVDVAGFPIEVTASKATQCMEPGIGIDNPCLLQTVSLLTVKLGSCEFPAPQNAQWQDIPFEGRDYIFSGRSYVCTTETTPFFGWYLRRQQP